MQATPLDHLLPTIVNHPDLHARWLNTFSFLEYVGFRKIVKSQSTETLSMATLSHAAEEARHALRLKRLALKIGGPKFNFYTPETLLCGDAAEEYFQKLDSYCESSLVTRPETIRARLTYLYVTLLVEVRALEVYRTYQRVLDEASLSLPLQNLLKEEESHLRYVQDELTALDADFPTRLSQFSKKEKELYENYLSVLAQENVHYA